jgi:hypothetical protein
LKREESGGLAGKGGLGWGGLMSTKVTYDDFWTQARCFNTAKPTGLSVLLFFRQISIFSYLSPSHSRGVWCMV